MEEDTSNLFGDKTPSVGENLCAWRRSVRLSVEDIASQLNIKSQIITALEAGDYHAFSAYVYAAGHLRRMVDHFAIADGDALVSAFRVEWEEKRGKLNNATYALPRSKRERWYITPRRLFSILGGVMMILFMWLLVTQLVGFTAAPSLRIDEPRQNIVTNIPIIRVRGTTEKESQLTVNGREITMNGNGVFDQEIELIAGLNSLHFLAQNRFGKISEETRYVVVR